MSESKSKSKPVFTDRTGREWKLHIDVAAIRRARKLDVDLSMPVNQLREFVTDDVFLADALWAILGPTAKAEDMSQETFEKAFTGPTYAQAREALWAAMELYFDPGKFAIWQAALKSIDKELKDAVTAIG